MRLTPGALARLGTPRAPEEAEAPPLELPAGVTLVQMMERVERQLVESTLRRCNYNKERAARELGLAGSALFRKLRDWGRGEEACAPYKIKAVGGADWRWVCVRQGTWAHSTCP